MDVKFTAALVGIINVMVEGEFENVIEIDRNKNILFDYGN